MYVPMIDNALKIQPPTTAAAGLDGPALDRGQGFAPGGLGKLLDVVVNVLVIAIACTGDCQRLNFEPVYRHTRSVTFAKIR